MDSQSVFPAMRRKEKYMEAKEMRGLLVSGEYGFLAMRGANGYGYGLPLSYVYEGGTAVFDNPATAKAGEVFSGGLDAGQGPFLPGPLGRIYFHCALKGFKVDSLMHNNKVSFCIVGAARLLPEAFSTAFSSVIMFGRMRKVSDESEIKHGLRLLLEKYSADFLEPGEKYIEKYLGKVMAACLEIENISGKSRSA